MFLLGSLASCVDQLKNVNKTDDRLLSVDGMVSDKIGSYTVNLNLRSPNPNLKAKTPVGNALVTVKDDLGNTYNFEERSEGIYESDPEKFRGRLGRSYTLQIDLDNGKTYRSRVEKLKAAPKIDTIIPVYIRKTSSQGASVGSFDLMGIFQDPASKGDYYLLDWAHYYSKSVCNTYTENGIRYQESCCDPCYGIQRPWGKANIVTDAYSNGYHLRQKITTISYYTRDPYFIVVDLYTISEATYNFWRLTNNQVATSKANANAENAPVTIPSNITNVANSKETVLGLFSAVGSFRKSFYVKRDFIKEAPTTPLPANNVPVASCAACNETWQSTRFKPAGWLN